MWRGGVHCSVTSTLSLVLLTLSSWTPLPPTLQSPLSGQSVLLPGFWSKERKCSLNTLLFPPSRGKLGMAGYLSAASSGGCLPWRHQPADSGDWIPSGHPAVIKSERQQAAELHSAQLGMAPDLGCSCRGTSDACPACFSSRGCHLTMSHELVVTPAIP